MDQNDTNSSKRPTGLIVGGIIVVAILILVGLFLPPVSLGERLGLTGSEASETGTEVAAEPESELESGTEPVEQTAVADGVALSLSEGKATIAVVPQDEFLADQADASTPDQVTLVSDVFIIEHEEGSSAGQVALPIPEGAGDYRSLDLYGWDGEKWIFMPSQIDPNSQQIVSMENELPQALVMANVSAPNSASAGAEVASGGSLPSTVLAHVNEVSVSELSLNSDGSVTGEVIALPEHNFEQWLRTTNVGPVVNQAALSAILDNEAAQAKLVDSLVKAAEAGFTGINLDYQQVPEGQIDAYTAFAGALAEALREQNQELLITLGTPAVSGSDWNTGGQNWVELGEIADVVYLQLPSDPTQFDAGCWDRSGWA